MLATRPMRGQQSMTGRSRRDRQPGVVVLVSLRATTWSCHRTYCWSAAVLMRQAAIEAEPVQVDS